MGAAILVSWGPPSWIGSRGGRHLGSDVVTSLTLKCHTYYSPPPPPPPPPEVPVRCSKFRCFYIYQIPLYTSLDQLVALISKLFHGVPHKEEMRHIILKIKQNLEKNLNRCVPTCTRKRMCVQLDTASIGFFRYSKGDTQKKKKKKTLIFYCHRASPLVPYSTYRGSTPRPLKSTCSIKCLRIAPVINCLCTIIIPCSDPLSCYTYIYISCIIPKSKKPG